MISFSVPGEPVPQGGMTAFVVGGRARVAHKNPQNLGDYRARIAMAAKQAGAYELSGPIAATVTFVLPRPKAHFGSGRNAGVLKSRAPRWHSGSRPDIDKVLRALLDGITGVCCRDDGQIAMVSMAKLYTSELHPSPCTEVALTQLEGTS